MKYDVYVRRSSRLRGRRECATVVVMISVLLVTGCKHKELSVLLTCEEGIAELSPTIQLSEGPLKVRFGPVHPKKV